MLNYPLLSFLTFLPLMGALLILVFLRGDEKLTHQNAKHTALFISIATLLLAIDCLVVFDPKIDDFQLTEYRRWFPGLNIGYHLGVDGLSLFFVILTAALMPLCILASWHVITERVKEYMVLFLILESFIIGIFTSLDFVLFYLFFEASLIPMFFIIGIWGGENRVYATFKFFLYTLLGSILLLLAMLYIYHHLGTTDIPTLFEKAPTLAPSVQRLLWLAFFASFAVKVPMWPVHTWLPDAHVQAPTAGSVILAAILLKLGAYGFLRFSLPMLPDASAYFAPLVYGLSITAIIYTSLVALAQTDMKKLIAYSSIAHMGYVTLGIFSFNVYGIEGALFQMLSHGLISGALFLCVGALYDRMHTKEISAFGGVAHQMPAFAFFFLVFVMGSVGLPSTSGFVGEFLAMLGIYQISPLLAFLSALGVVLGAAYMLFLTMRVVFGPKPTTKELLSLKDLTPFEKATLVPLAISVGVFGVFPNLILTYIEPSVMRLVHHIHLNISTSSVAEIQQLATIMAN